MVELKLNRVNRAYRNNKISRWENNFLVSILEIEYNGIKPISLKQQMIFNGLWKRL